MMRFVVENELSCKIARFIPRDSDKRLYERELLRKSLWWEPEQSSYIAIHPSNG
jgi:hypothetical protein